jgi:hypothetical protein
MSWVPIAPASRPSRADRPAVTASSTAGRARMRPALHLVIRHRELAAFGDLARGAGVTVELGEGEHAGMLRIRAGGEHILQGVARAKPPGSLVQLRLPLPPRVEPKARPATGCTVTEGTGGWLVLTLPAWANPPRQPTSPERGRELAAAAAAEARRRAAG